MAEIKEIFKIQPTNATSSVNIPKKELRLNDIEHESELDRFVIMWSTKYTNQKGNVTNLHKEIFGQYKKNYLNTVSIVKIQASTGKTIYREYQGRAISGMNDKMIALTPNSIKLLSQINDEGKVVTPNWLILSPGHWFPFYWNHPDKGYKLSLRIGFWGIVLSVISIIFTIIL